MKRTALAELRKGTSLRMLCTTPLQLRHARLARDTVLLLHTTYGGSSGSHEHRCVNESPRGLRREVAEL
eukprot:3317829-Amphidinium_carterae.2